MPEAILRKPAPLTMEERLLVRQHPQIACDLLNAVPYLTEAATVVRDVHERVDQRGYPRGVALDDVALAAKIVAVVDTYDTVTRPRVFRDALPPAEALLELDRCKGSQFDADVVDAFHRLLNGGCLVPDATDDC
jgi:HD-GYP domain-containing protein (c-di-GMP phosphodiesterase class II)